MTGGVDKNPLEGFFKYLNQILAFCRETLKIKGIDVGGKKYQAYLKSVPLAEFVKVMTHEFIGRPLSHQPDAQMSERSIAKNKNILLSIHLIELCQRQIGELSQISELTSSDLINADLRKFVELKVAILLTNQWDIDNLACGLGITSVEDGAISRSQRRRTEKRAETNEILVMNAANQILQDDDLKSSYFYHGGKRDGELKVSSLAHKISEMVELKHGTITRHIKNLIVKNKIPEKG